ncbi:MAG: PASTA domain-containing protein [Prevotellaceae bacterium]|jgi:beta-lactam-binding protein with PASTA domain|nr:PASTA domain-containing protein [Prevotellaceae bacterium]
MGFKKFWKDSFIALIIKNILIALAVLLVLGRVTLIIIAQYTHHNVSETVPDVRGMYVEEAISELKRQHLYIDVIDSLFVKNKPLGAVLEQTPAPGAKVKPNRPVYLVINSMTIRQIPLPDILETSYRNATASLQSIGMSVRNVEYVNSEYKDLVLSIKYRGSEIRPGARIPDGSAVTLVVGRGLSDIQSGLPSVKGMTLAQATDVLTTAGFVVGTTEIDPHAQGNAENYIIYRQRPAAGRTIPQGSRVDIWLTSDESLLHKDKEGDNDEEFF